MRTKTVGRPSASQCRQRALRVRSEPPAEVPSIDPRMSARTRQVASARGAPDGVRTTPRHDVRMHSVRLLPLIGRSFEDELRSRQDLDGMDAEPALTGLSVRDLPRFMRERTESDYQQDRVLAAVIRC